MKRVVLLACLLPLSLFSCHQPVAAKENAVLKDADTSFAAGKYDEALHKYEAAYRHAGDEPGYTRALYRAVECETLLYRQEAALDRIRAARLPGDVVLRGILELTRFAMLKNVAGEYGFSEETEEGAQGSAKLSRAAAEKEMLAAEQALWSDRAALAKAPLKDLGDYFVVEDADLARYPSLWDFAVLKMGQALTGARKAIDPAQFAAEDFPRDFSASLPPLVRAGALYEESAHLSSAGNRKSAGERWRVARVMLGGNVGGNATQRKAWANAARERLASWAQKLDTPLGRGDAAAKAAQLYASDKQCTRALALIDAALPHTPESDVAVELRRQRRQIVQPELSLVAKLSPLPAKKALTLTARNVATVYLRLYRERPTQEVGNDFFSSHFSQPAATHVVSRLTSDKPVAEWKWTTGDKGDHEFVTADVDAPAPGLGVYLVVASADQNFAVGGETLRGAYLNVTDLAVARVEGRRDIRYYVFDGNKRAPASGVTFRLQTSTNWSTKSSDEIRAGGDGIADWPAPPAEYMQVDAMAMRGDAVGLFQNPSWLSRERDQPPLILYLATDRPIYRPGQTVDVRVTSIERAREGYKVDAHRKIQLVLSDANGKEVGKQSVTTGAMGSAMVKFELPRSGLLGSYSLNASAPGVPDVSAYHGVRVEEYKRPEFEVTLDAPKSATRYGDKTRVSGSVKYYFGGAASGVAVKFKIFRRRWIPWWLYYRGTTDKTELTRGESKTNDKGAFDVDFVAARDPESAASDDADAPDISDFIVEVEAHDAGGRTISAERQVRVGAQSVLLNADAENGFFMSDEHAELRVKATNLEEQPVDAAVEWSVEPLEAPREPVTADSYTPLQSMLSSFPARAAVAHGTVRAGKDAPATLALPQLPAGAYRVRLADKQSGARGQYHVLVADAKTRALPFAALPALAIARKNDLEPGRTAELLVGDGAASGAYHLETWQGDKLAAHELSTGAPLRVVRVPVTQKLAGGFTTRFIGVRGLAVVGGDVAVRVPRKDKLLAVKLEPKPAALTPGEKARFGVAVVDGHGKPVAGEALVTIYDRSLELYARGTGGWAESLWSAPGPPRQRTDAPASRWGTQVPADPLTLQKIEQQIMGTFRAQRIPAFTWEQSRYSGYGSGGGGFRALGGVAPGSPPPPPSPQAVAAPARMMVAEKRSAARGEPDRDHDGIPDNANKEDADERSREQKPPAPSEPALRTNMAETALFLPNLQIGGDGKGTFEVTAPERLTSWRVQALVLGKLVEVGSADGTFATRKELMVRVEIPRFVREGDRSTIAAIVHNETDHPLAADVKLAIVDDAGKKDALAALGVKDASRHVEVPAHGLVPVEFAIVAPENIATYLVRASATAGKLSDAEERPLPLLPSRERLVQSRVVALRGNDKQTIEFPELQHSTDASLRSESMTVSIDPQLALSVLRSIPYLVEYPYECVEQTLNRYVPLTIVGRIYKEHPELARAIAKAPHRETQFEPWLKDDPRRMTQLTETPWLRDSEGGSNDARLQGLLDPAVVEQLGRESLQKLQAAQNASGAFPWFPGGRDNFYMTLYVLEQLAQLRDFGVELPAPLVKRALSYVRGEMGEHLKGNEADVAFLAYGAYVVTAFGDHFADAQAMTGDVKKWMKYVLDNRRILTPYGRAWCARVEARLGDRKLALELLDSALDGAKNDPVTGVSWTPERYSWLWYSDSVEKHAFFLRTLAALKPDDAKVPGMLQWLLFNRKGNQWHSTKASAAAVYAILDLMKKQGSLDHPEKFRVQWVDHEDIVTVKPDEDRREPLLWTRRGRDVTPAAGKVDVGKEGPGIAFASATWIFSSTKLQEAHASNLVSLERKFFKKVHQADGDHLVPLSSGDTVRVGDEIEVRLYVKTQSQFEFVQVKEPRGAGFEETTLTSGWRWDRLASYQEPRDSLFNFFVDWLPHGEFELRHSLRPTTPGTYRISSAVLQSMYSPDVTAYSSGLELTVLK
jgi:alpha-2-macroglobulin